MKKYKSILDYMEQYQEKYAIRYAKTNGTLYNSLSVFALLFGLYGFVMSVLAIASTYMNAIHGKIGYDISEINRNVSFVTIIICTVIMLVSAVLYWCKLKSIALIIQLITQPLMMIFFSHITVKNSGISGQITAYYWRHFLPAAMLMFFAAWMLLITFREKIKKQKLYNYIVANLYKLHKVQDGVELTDEQWEEYLKNYNPHN